MATLDWGRILKVDLELLAQKDESEIDEELEALYDVLVDTRVRLDDPRATAENLIHLFQVTQLVMENKHQILEETEQEVQLLEARVTEQQSELDRVLSGDSASYLKQIEELQKDVSDLEERNSALTKALATAEERLDSERERITNLSTQLTAERTKSSNFEDTIARMKLEIKDYQSQLQNQKDRMQTKTLDDDQIRKQLRDKNAELNKYLSEVQLLSEDNGRLASKVEALTEELEAAVNELEKSEHELRGMNATISEYERQIIHFTDEKNALQVKFDDNVNTLTAIENVHRQAMEDLERELHHYKRALEDSKRNGAEGNIATEALHQEIFALREKLQQYNVDTVEERIREKDTVISELKQKLTNAYHDFELLNVDWSKVDQALSAGKRMQSDVPVPKDAVSDALLTSKLEAYRKRQRRFIEQMRAADAQLQERDKELLELRSRLNLYEQGLYGVREANAEIQDLRSRIKLREEELAQRTNDANELDRRLQEVYEENEELLSRVKTHDDTVDVTSIRARRAGELQKAQALIKHLQSEIDKLEEERLQLKACLRLQAINRGERAFQLGLTSEQIVQLEECTERMRLQCDGMPSTPMAPVEDPASQSNRLEQLTVELQRAQTQGTEARAESKRLQTELNELRSQHGQIDEAMGELLFVMVELLRGFDADGVPLEGSFEPLVQIAKGLHSRNYTEKRGCVNSIGHAIRALRDERSKYRCESAQLNKQLDAIVREKERLEAELEGHRLTTTLSTRNISLDLPSTLARGNAYDFALLADQLVQCMGRLRDKDRALRDCNFALQKYKSLYATLSGRQRQLYREHQKTCAQHEATVAGLTSRLSDTVSARDIAELKVNELVELLRVIESTSSQDIVNALIDCQRRVTVLKVDEKTLGRQIYALQDSENMLRKENTRLAAEVLSLDRLARQTLSRLSIAKGEAVARCERIQLEFSESVPIGQHIQLSNKLNLHVSHVRQLLEREAELVAEIQRERVQTSEVRELRSALDLQSLALAEAREKVEKLEGVLASLQLTGPVENDGTRQANVVEMHRLIVNLEVQVQLHENRARIADRKCVALIENENVLKERLSALESHYTEAKAETFQLREIEAELRNTIAASISPTEHQNQVKRISNLEDEIRKLQSQLEEYQRISEIASRQVADVIQARAIEQDELGALRATVRELQAETDEKLLIGRLHHEIHNLRVSEISVRRTLESLQGKNHQLQSRIVHLEFAVESKEKAMLSLRLKQREHSRLLRRTNLELRQHLAGSVHLEKHQRMCALARALDASKAKLLAELASVLEETRISKMQLSEARQRVDSLNKLVGDLKGSSDNAERIALSHRKMMESHLNYVRLQRDLQHEKESHRQTMNTLEDSRKRLVALEDEVARLQEESDQKQLEWVNIQELFDKEPESFDNEHIRAMEASSADHPPPFSRDPSHPEEQWPGAASCFPSQHGQLVTANETRIASLEETIRDLKSKLSASDQASNTASANPPVACTKLDIEQDHPLEASTESVNVVRKRPIRSTLVDATQSNTLSLQRQLRHKDDMLAKYRVMLHEVREDIKTRHTEYRTVIKEREAALIKIHKRLLERLRKVPERGITSNTEDSNVKCTTNQYWELFNAKEQELSTFRKQMEELRIEAENQKRQWHVEIKRLEEEVRHRDARLQEATAEIGRLTYVANNLQLQAAELPSPQALSLIAKLQREAQAKDIKQANLVATIHEMRVNAINMAETSALSHLQELRDHVDETLRGASVMGLPTARSKRERPHYQEACSQKAEQPDKDNERIADLQASLKRSRAEVRRLAKKLATMAADTVSQRASTNAVGKQADDSSNPQGLRTTTPSLEKWHKEKQLKQKLDKLRMQLDQKTKEADAAIASLLTTREAYQRSERERMKLREKVKSLTSLMAAKVENQGDHRAVASNQPEGWRIDVLVAMRSDIEQLEASVTDWKRKASIGPATELLRAQQELAEKSDQIRVLEEVNEQLHNFYAVAEEHNKRNTENVGQFLDNKIRDLMRKCEGLATIRTETESNLLRARFERDEALHKARRAEAILQKFLRHSAYSLSGLEGLPLPAAITDSSPGSQKMLRESLQPLPSSFRSELIVAIKNLCQFNDILTKQVLQSNNCPATHQQLLKECKNLRQELKEKTEELEASPFHLNHSERLEEENKRLRKQYNKVERKSCKQAARIRELELMTEKLKEEMTAGLVPENTYGQSQTHESDEAQGSNQRVVNPDIIAANKMAGENKATGHGCDSERSLQGQLPKPVCETQITGFHTPILHSSPQRVQSVNALQKENSRLREKLLTLESSFHEEVEDLKWNYRDSVRVNVHYEEAIRDLCDRTGFAAEDIFKAIKSSENEDSQA
ncbi:hypothetical protein HDU85_007815 [Gaertneriomyces sp. JEL0708]|nr:hypothetical protein HDU85_007815 [Gaertneriomyces sp. JEL0708]